MNQTIAIKRLTLNLDKAVRKKEIKAAEAEMEILWQYGRKTPVRQLAHLNYKDRCASHTA